MVTVRRVEHGRWHDYEEDGARVMGVTRAIRDGVPKPALVGWAANVTADYAVDHWDELAELGVSERLGILKGSRFESSDEAKARGQDVHRLAHALAAGEDVFVADELKGYVDAVERFWDDWNVEDVELEAVVYNPAERYAGTLDALARINGCVWLLDYKTGKAIYPEVALQLTAYSRCELVNDDGTLRPMPRIDAAAAVLLHQDGTYDFVPVVTSEDVFEVFLCAREVAAFAARLEDNRKAKELPYVLAPALQPPTRFEP